MAAFQEDDFFIAAGSGSHHRIFPGVEIASTSGQELMLCVVTFEPDGVVPDHSHPHEQMGLLISGRLQFTIGGLTKVLGPGDKWRIPGGVVHKVVAARRAGRGARLLSSDPRRLSVGRMFGSSQSGENDLSITSSCRPPPQSAGTSSSSG